MNKDRSNRLRLKLGRHRIEAHGTLAVGAVLVLLVCQLAFAFLLAVELPT